MAADFTKGNSQVAAIVVAAGSGVRLRAGIPKALVRVGGKSLVLWAVQALAFGGVTEVVVVAPTGQLTDFEEALSFAPVPCLVVAGGATRGQSVANGLQALNASSTTADVVLVHDAARPLVPGEVVARVIAAVQDGATVVVPVVPISDTVRQLTTAGSAVIERSSLRAVQTPQGFRRDVLTQTYTQTDIAATDDATLAERLGHVVKLVEGSPSAMKVTNPHDLMMVSAMLEV
ncbi:MAG: 2-C-methyl-D-erythritol 4-phosphate cytidylyltransferase [Propionibacteriaceae bacterium]|jgi:2-C-methyl-D-erythritol 4-phosphate cytidylyltransferase|nr:2-C-methyl-D-erythritol 4-phosphate cytidylyltransferase [Propionibacteriaceae bacterium]